MFGEAYQIAITLQLHIGAVRTLALHPLTCCCPCVTVDFHRRLTRNLPIWACQTYEGLNPLEQEMRRRVFLLLHIADKSMYVLLLLFRFLVIVVE